MIPTASPDRRGVLRGGMDAWSEGGALLFAARTARRSSEALERTADAFAVAGATRAVRRLRPTTVEEAIEFAYTFEYGGVSIRPMQLANEIRAFLELLEANPPRTVVEIGTGRGGTFFLLGHAAHETALLVSIDAPEADGFGGRAAYKRRAGLYRAFARTEQRVEYIVADSHHSATYERILGVLGRERVDALFIDGDHTLGGVETDFRLYSPLVRSGGIVAFHDIVPGLPEAVGGVPTFWKRIRNGNSLELVDDWNQGCCGIGVLRL
jgi:predicted O-methyltransferase YrrM